MKKGLFLGFLVIFMAFAPLVKADAPSDAYCFLDNKCYNEKQVQTYFCFLDGKCYTVEGKFAFSRTPTTIPAVLGTTTPLPIYDACPNLPGNQGQEPQGMVKKDGNCVYPVDSSLTCSQQIANTNQQLLELSYKFETDKQALLPLIQDSSYGTKLNDLMVAYTTENQRLNLLLNQLKAGYTCKD